MAVIVGCFVPARPLGKRRPWGLTIRAPTIHQTVTAADAKELDRERGAGKTHPTKTVLHQGRLSLISERSWCDAMLLAVREHS
jgi:hypothetical protein